MTAKPSVDESFGVFAPGILRGHVALITGGGTGICRGIAEGYKRLGADVCIVSRKQDVIEKAAADIGGDTLGLACDVRKPDDVARVVEACVAKFGKLDTVVNGAAGNFLAPAAALTPNGFKTVVEIDLMGSFHVARAAFAALQKSGDGLIVNITATLHFHGTPLQLHASAAKAGVDAMTKNLAVEWGRFGIRVNSIAPGPIEETEGMRRLAPNDPGGVGEKARAAIPAGRFGAIHEIGAAAVFLRSAAARYISGHVLVVDGGQCVATPPLGMTF